MSTSRHPAYRRTNVPAADLIDSTEAARIFAEASQATDAQGWRRLEQLRSTGKMVPAQVDHRAVRWDRLEVQYHASPWSYDTPADPLSAVKGVMFACAIGGLVLGVVAFNVWYWVVR